MIEMNLAFLVHMPVQGEYYIAFRELEVSSRNRYPSKCRIKEKFLQLL